VATSGKDGTVRIWDIYSGRVLRTFSVDRWGVLSMATSPAGSFLATGGGSGTVKLWKLGAEDEERDVDATEREGWTPLHVAAWDGDLSAARSELGKGVPVDVRNAMSRTPLYNAAKRGHRAVVALLVERGAAVDAVADRGYTPLYVGVQNGHGEVVDLLIARGADLEHKNGFGQSYLYKAAENGHVEIARTLIQRGAALNEQDRGRWAPLSVASRHGHARVVELLLAQPEVDVSVACGPNDLTPLMLAAEFGHEDVVRQLIDHGADVNARTKGGETALLLAVQYKQEKTAALLRASGAR
jgi:ankyrin repeat protein